MSASTVQAMGAGLFFAVILLTGFWLSRAGKPYRSLVLNIHKLIALAAATLFVWTLVRQSHMTAFDVWDWVAGIGTGLCFLTTGITGGLVSLESPMPALISLIHRVGPYLTVITAAVALYLLSGGTA